MNMNGNGKEKQRKNKSLCGLENIKNVKIK